MRTLPIVVVALTLGFAPGVLCSQQPQAQTPPEADTRIPSGARIFITPLDNGYHIYLAAAIQNKKVPVVLVTDKSRADFELSAVTESEQASWAKMLFTNSGATDEEASIQIVNIKSGTIVFGYNVNKSSSARGKQSSSEACAKHLKQKIESGK